SCFSLPAFTRQNQKRFKSPCQRRPEGAYNQPVRNVGICLILTIALSAQAADVTTVKATTEPVVDRSASLIEAIRQSPDPSSAIQAYARAIASQPADTPLIEQAYVRRMVELSVPEMADAQ